MPLFVSLHPLQPNSHHFNPVYLFQPLFVIQYPLSDLLIHFNQFFIPLLNCLFITLHSMFVALPPFHIQFATEIYFLPTFLSLQATFIHFYSLLVTFISFLLLPPFSATLTQFKSFQLLLPTSHHMNQLWPTFYHYTRSQFHPFSAILTLLKPMLFIQDDLMNIGIIFKI